MCYLLVFNDYSANGEESRTPCQASDIEEGVEAIPGECKGVGRSLSPFEARNNYFFEQSLHSRRVSRYL